MKRSPPKLCPPLCEVLKNKKLLILCLYSQGTYNLEWGDIQCISQKEEFQKISVTCALNADSSKFTESIKKQLRTSLEVPWLRLQASDAGGVGSIPGQGTKIPHATPCSMAKKKNKKKQLNRAGCAFLNVHLTGYVWLHDNMDSANDRNSQLLWNTC